MDRGRRAEPYSNATIWTREIARNLAGHLSRVSKAHSCVDTKSPKSTRLPQFYPKRCPTSPLKTRQPFVAIPHLTRDQNAHVGGSSREESDGASPLIHTPEVENCRGGPVFDTNNGNPQYRTVPSHEANQEVSDAQGRIPAVKPPARQHVRNSNANCSDIGTYDSPPVLLHQRHHQANDYYKRQEQRKIWQENQALNKRIQTAKATLNFKEWEKDDKWSQEFLKHQEKRRYALQQELRRAQVSPQAVLRSKPLKSLHPRHAKSAALEMEENLELDRTKTDVARALSSRDLLRRGSKDRVVLGSRGGSDTTVQRASAANHRRIVELRKKKPSSPGLADCVEPSSTDLDPVYTTKAPAEQTAFIPDNEIVTVRFTFSRGRSRGTDNNTSALEQTDQPSPLEVDGSDGDMMSLSGAFSPGVELESALNDAVESCDHPRSPSKTADDPDLHDNNNSHDEAAHLAEIDVNTPQELATRAGDSLDEKKAIQNIPEEMVAASRGESNIHTQSDDEEDESYGDIFDDEALPSARASQQQHDRLEASGYASEFEDDVAPNVIPTAGQDGPVSPDEANEEEYFHDDFE